MADLDICQYCIQVIVFFNNNDLIVMKFSSIDTLLGKQGQGCGGETTTTFGICDAEINLQTFIRHNKNQDKMTVFMQAYSNIQFSSFYS